MIVVRQLLVDLFRLFSSLKLAVVVILGLVSALAAGTIIESIHDTPSSQFWVYRSLWFHALLCLLGVNIFCVAMSRFPWKLKHIPFLMAHAGILILLAGSWLTERVGIDGSLRVSEGETTGVVDLDESHFIVAGLQRDPNQILRIPVPWLPPSVPFGGITIPRVKNALSQGQAESEIPPDIKIDQYITHADPEYSFLPDLDPRSLELEKQAHSSAVLVKVTGGPMRITQEIWLWEGSPNWKNVQAGPAQFSMQRGLAVKPQEAEHSGPSLVIRPEGSGFRYETVSSAESGRKKVSGVVKAQDIASHPTIHPGWKGDVTLQILNWIPRARLVTTYKPARIQYGPQAPLAAIHVSAVEKQIGIWLGLGDRAILHTGSQELEIGFLPRRIVLPFSVRLERFTVEHDPGTANPSAYKSLVTTVDPQTEQKKVPGKGPTETLISMNEPLEHRGFRLYQASYEEAQPRPITSILAVNRDPGRFWKYLGSALIVAGSILLFAAKYRKKRQDPQLDLALAVESGQATSS